MVDVLKKHFQFDNFLPLQEEIISDIIAKKDVLVLLPTGGGKSLCYQLPALMFPGLTIVVSPLISLMKDQVMSLSEGGIPAAYLNSSQGVKETREVKKRVLYGEIKLLYVAPERLLHEGFSEFLERLNISLIAIDEAHCISEWGHDFRPEYRKLNLLRQMFPRAPIVALTATATQKVKDDIVRQLNFKNHSVYVGSFNRKNLSYKIRPKQEAYSQIVNYIEDHPTAPGIIYCHSRAAVDRMAEHLLSDGIEALPYHAGMSQKERNQNQERFMRGDAKIIIATIAFGMGIDKSDIRFVIHYNLPKNIEGYYQETGRAGRDGKPADCILFFSYADKIKHEFFITKKKNIHQQTIAQMQLDTMVTFCTANICRRKMLLQYFGERLTELPCSGCDVCGYNE